MENKRILNIRRIWSRVEGGFSRSLLHILRNVWIVQIISTAFLIGAFTYLWIAAKAQIPAGATNVSGGLLAVLAITNAIPVAAAASFLARFNANDRTTDGLGALAKVVSEHSSRLDGHPRVNPSMRWSNYKKLLGCQTTPSFIFNVPGRAMVLTPRPNWDGVWYYGNDDVPELEERYPTVFRASHEVVYCAWNALKIVDRMRGANLGLLFRNGRGGTQGSRWFLEKLDQHGLLIRKPILGTLSRQEGITLANMAIYSWHYMYEEIRECRETAQRDEFREARFGAQFCLYLTWLNYFMQKATDARFEAIRTAGKARPALIAGRNAYLANTGALKKAVDELCAGFLARVAVAGRIHRVRQGAICPIVVTALALTCHLVLQPIIMGQAPEWIVDCTAVSAYALSAAAVIGNFLFAIWLLVPALSGE